MVQKISKSSESGIPPSLSVPLSHMEQRIERLEEHLGELMKNGNKEESKETMGQLQMPDANGVRNMMTRHEACINDMILRLSELESSIGKLEPNNIRALIKDIAELVMEEQTRGVNQTVDSLKGTEKKNEYLVNMLKEELKIMDERFKQDIEKKIERSDLYLTKTQLQRKVFYLLILVKST